MQKTRFALTNLIFKSNFAGLISLMSFTVIFSFLTLLLRAENEKEVSIDEKFTTSLQYQPITIEDLDIGDEYLFEQSGTASWYGRRFHNKKTASGEKYDMNKLSAAHKNLPFGTILKVTDKESGNMTFVRINDRGPFVKNRVIDLSYKALDNLGGKSHSNVTLEGIVPQKIKDSRELNEPFALAYSFDDDVACVPAKVFEVLDSAKDFHRAVRKYELLRDLHSANSVFLIVPLNYALDGDNENAGIYYIGLFQPHKNNLVKDLKLK